VLGVVGALRLVYHVLVEDGAVYVRNSSNYLGYSVYVVVNNSEKNQETNMARQLK